MSYRKFYTGGLPDLKFPKVVLMCCCVRLLVLLLIHALVDGDLKVVRMVVCGLVIADEAIINAAIVTL